MSNVNNEGLRTLDEIRASRAQCGDLGQVQGASREHLEREVNRLTAEIHNIRQRFSIDPGEDLYEGLSRKVGELQTSEAELVSAPLKARIAELEQSIQADVMPGK